MRFLRENSLSIVFGLLFLGSLVGQAVAGHNLFNEDQMAHHESAISFGRYLTSSNFGQAVMENWQSEFLQFALYILFTVWFVQRGSTESKSPGDEGHLSPRDQQIGRYAGAGSPAWARVGGARTFLFSNSLVLLMAAIFIGTWFADSVSGWSSYNQDQKSHHQSSVSYPSYLGSSDFWQSTLQNWQSEFLAIGSMAIFSVYLRQRGSPESKPVGAPNVETGSEGGN